uniref:Uncharacterized protein n=1 Tax=Hyaloperonospora arabidopsidis (strain Emoy2) TaxID=559515 RepID=M4B5L8_HYAAE
MVGTIAVDFIPPVLSHQLVKLCGRYFADIIHKQRYRLSAHWSEQSIELIEQDFQELRAAYEREPSLKQVLDKCDVNIMFENGCNYVQQCFEHLETFCGGLATAFLGTCNM